MLAHASCVSSIHCWRRWNRWKNKNGELFRDTVVYFSTAYVRALDCNVYSTTPAVRWYTMTQRTLSGHWSVWCLPDTAVLVPDFQESTPVYRTSCRGYRRSSNDTDRPRSRSACPAWTLDMVIESSVWPTNSVLVLVTFNKLAKRFCLSF